MKRSLGLYLLSPGPLVAIAWLFMIAGVVVGYGFRHDLPVMRQTMRQYGIDFQFPVEGMIWIALTLFASLLLGAAATRPIPQASPPLRPSEFSLPLKIAALVHVFITLVVMVWITAGAASAGSFGRLAAMAAEQDTYTAKALLLDNKLFPGMRLLYTGLCALGLIGACVFALNVRSGERVRRDMQIGLLMFLVSAAVLSILPIFLSQRILLIHMVLSTFIAVSLISGRLVKLRYGIGLVVLLFVVWSMREAVTTAEWAPEHSSARLGTERLIYYFVNDFYNAVMPFSREFDNTYGLHSFRFMLVFSGTEDAVTRALSENIEASDQLRAGGEFPAFTAPYVDFSWLGIVLIGALVVLFTWIFNKAHHSFAFAVVYGQIGAALLLGLHSSWYSHPNFIFNIVMTVVICAFIPRKKTRVARIARADRPAARSDSSGVARSEPWRRGMPQR